MRLSLIGLFLLKAIAWFVAWLLVWYALRDWVSIPVALLTKATVAMLFPSWAEGVEHAGPVLTLLTSLEVHGMAGVPLGQVPLFAPESSVLKFGYGLPMLLSLLLASNAKNAVRKAVLGALALLPVQVWGVCFDWLDQLANLGGALPYSLLTRDLIALGKEFGTLIMPALVPVLLWLALDRRFLTTLMVEATLEGVIESEDA